LRQVADQSRSHSSNTKLSKCVFRKIAAQGHLGSEKCGEYNMVTMVVLGVLYHLLPVKIITSADYFRDITQAFESKEPFPATIRARGNQHVFWGHNEQVVVPEFRSDGVVPDSVKVDRQNAVQIDVMMPKIVKFDASVLKESRDLDGLLFGHLFFLAPQYQIQVIGDRVPAVIIHQEIHS
jgi:hypothetical protein